jgi:hypothetical protein
VKKREREVGGSKRKIEGGQRERYGGSHSFLSLLRYWVLFEEQETLGFVFQGYATITDGYADHY